MRLIMYITNGRYMILEQSLPYTVKNDGFVRIADRPDWFDRKIYLRGKDKTQDTRTVKTYADVTYIIDTISKELFNGMRPEHLANNIYCWDTKFVAIKLTLTSFVPIGGDVDFDEMVQAWEHCSLNILDRYITTLSILMDRFGSNVRQEKDIFMWQN